MASLDGTAENRAWEFVPSVTWICDVGYPMGYGLRRWLANRSSWDEAEEIKSAAGEKGSKVHQGVRIISEGGAVTLSDAFTNPNTMKQEEVTAEEYFAMMTFKQWCDDEEPEFLANEYTVWNEKYRYAGTIDLKCRLKSTRYQHIHIVDIKTSSSVFTPMELQVSAYKHADLSLPKAGVKLGILQVGYKPNKKKKFKYTEVPDRFPLFLAARKIWVHEAGSVRPLQRDYPLSISLVAPMDLRGAKTRDAVFAAVTEKELELA